MFGGATNDDDIYNFNIEDFAEPRHKAKAPLQSGPDTLLATTKNTTKQSYDDPLAKAKALLNKHSAPVVASARRNIAAYDEDDLSFEEEESGSFLESADNAYEPTKSSLERPSTDLTMNKARINYQQDHSRSADFFDEDYASEPVLAHPPAHQTFQLHRGGKDSFENSYEDIDEIDEEVAEDQVSEVMDESYRSEDAPATRAATVPPLESNDYSGYSDVEEERYDNSRPVAAQDESSTDDVDEGRPQLKVMNFADLGDVAGWDPEPEDEESPEEQVQSYEDSFEVEDSFIPSAKVAVEVPRISAGENTAREQVIAAPDIAHQVDVAAHAVSASTVVPPSANPRETITTHVPAVCVPELPTHHPLEPGPQPKLASQLPTASASEPAVQAQTTAPVPAPAYAHSAPQPPPQANYAPPPLPPYSTPYQMPPAGHFANAPPSPYAQFQAPLAYPPPPYIQYIPTPMYIPFPPQMYWPSHPAQFPPGVIPASDILPSARAGPGPATEDERFVSKAQHLSLVKDLLAELKSSREEAQNNAKQLQEALSIIRIMCKPPELSAPAAARDTEPTSGQSSANIDNETLIAQLPSASTSQPDSHRYAALDPTEHVEVDEGAVFDERPEYSSDFEESPTKAIVDQAPEVEAATSAVESTLDATVRSDLLELFESKVKSEQLRSSRSDAPVTFDSLMHGRDESARLERILKSLDTRSPSYKDHGRIASILTSLEARDTYSDTLRLSASALHTSQDLFKRQLYSLRSRLSDLNGNPAPSDDPYIAPLSSVDDIRRQLALKRVTRSSSSKLWETLRQQEGGPLA